MYISLISPITILHTYELQGIYIPLRHMLIYFENENRCHLKLMLWTWLYLVIYWQNPCLSWRNRLVFVQLLMIYWYKIVTQLVCKKRENITLLSCKHMIINDKDNILVENCFSYSGSFIEGNFRSSMSVVKINSAKF